MSIPITPTMKPDPQLAVGAQRELERAKPKIISITPDRFVEIGLEIPTAVGHALSYADDILAHRDQLAQLPFYDITAVDNVGPYARALYAAHINLLTATGTTEPLDEMRAELEVVRQDLIADLTSLSRHRVVDGTALTKLHGGNGYKNPALDVSMLTTVLINAWDQIKTSTPRTRESLDEAAQLAERMIAVVGDKETSPAIVSEAATLRKQAYTLFINTYGEARRGILFLRAPHGDADKIAPSLYSNRGGGGRRSAEAEAGPAPAPASPAPATPAKPAVGGGFADEDPFIKP